MADVSVQVREYFEHMADHVEVEEITQRRQLLEPPRPERRGWLVAAAAAVVVLVILGGAAWLLRGGSTGTDEPADFTPGPAPAPTGVVTAPVISPSLAPQPESSTVSAPTPIPEPTPATIDSTAAPSTSAEPTSPPATELPAPAPTTEAGPLIAPADGRLRSIVSGAAGFVAVGESDDVPAVWTSPDATEWKGEQVGNAGGVMSDIAIGGPGFVAVGASEGMPAVWTSPDGSAWTQVFTGDAPGAIVRVSFLEEMVVATGYLECGGDCDATEAGWISEDGLSWRAADHSETIRTLEEADGTAALVANLEADHMALTVDGQWMPESTVEPARIKGGAPVEAVVPLEDGRLVAVGRTCDYSISLWLSRDGSVWTWVPLQPRASADVIVFGAAEGNGQIVMVGAQGGGRAFVRIMPLEDLQEMPVPTGQRPAEPCA